MRDYNALAARIHKLNKRWWTDLETGKPIFRNDDEMFMLMVSELAEAMEGERKDLMDDHLPHRKMAEVEMADFVIRALDIAGKRKCNLNHWLPSDAKNPFGENRGAYLFGIVKTLTFHASRNDINLTLSSAINLAEIYCWTYGYNLYAALEEKLAYNQTRTDHTHEARKAANGKKW